MRAEIETQIEAYVHQHLSPKDNERALIAGRYAILQQILEGVIFQTGSYARYTSITPVNDLDVIWQLPEHFLPLIRGQKAVFKSIDADSLNINRILQDLADRLTAEYLRMDSKVRVRAQSHSVGIYFGQTDEEFSIDIVPAVPSGKPNEYLDPLYIVPDIVLMKKADRLAKYAHHDRISWLDSDPRGYKTAAEILNSKTTAYRRAAKVIKAWKRACKMRNGVFPLKSFHLEIIVQGITSADTSLDTISTLGKAFELLPKCIHIPRYPDRADDSKFIDEYVRDIPTDIRQVILSEINQAITIVTQIASENDPDKAERALRRLIGHAAAPSPSPLWVAPAVSRPYYESN